MAVPAAETMACPRCGEGRPDGARFCLRCGVPFSTDRPTDGLPRSMWGPAAVGLPAPSAVGRRASRAGWIGVLLGAGAFLAAALGVIAAAGNPDARMPTARWDDSIRNPTWTAAGSPFDVSVEAANPAATSTDRLWLVVEWRPDGLGDTAVRLVACQPTDCQYREDAVAGITVVVWPGLTAGSHHEYSTTLAVDRAAAGESVVFRVSAGTGAAETRLRGVSRWTVAMDIR